MMHQDYMARMRALVRDNQQDHALQVAFDRTTGRRWAREGNPLYTHLLESRQPATPPVRK